ncbi:MAG: hypothetical protein QOG63_2509, partial [Thermoleophilaceae bacterium]|nr:hypothetical protein [Thermoleophilaceae bacterium]
MLVVRLFGELRLELDGECVHPPTRRSGRMLLGYLALHRGMHARGDLAALIWPDILESSARASLRSAIAAIRRTLGTAADLYLLRAGDTVGLAGADAGVSVDLERFETLAAAGELEAALGLSQGSLLQGLDAEWVRDARVQHAARVSELLGILASDAERSGSLEDAIRYTRRQVALSPLAEPPNRELIRRLAAAGDRASALMVYGELAERFRRELQAVPSAETRRLASEARRGPVTDVGAAPLPLPPVLDAALRDPFVDRVAELSELSSSLARAAAGQRQTVLVVGEPGIGKSALLARFAAVAAPSATVLFGHCRRPPSTALEPFVEALRHYVTAAAAERLERELPAAAGELAGLVPGIAERLVGVPLPPDLLEDGGRIARAVVETLLALSRARPLVLFLEDLHEGDAATVQLLARLVAGPEPARLMVVSTLRDTELGRSTTLQRLTRELRALPGTLHMALDGLDASAIGDLARAIRSDDLAPGDASRLHSRTHGNPFFAARLLESDDPLAGWPLPERVEDLVWEEIARLSADAQNCLAVAATVGVEFDLGGVMRVAGYGEDRALDALDEAVVAHVVRELPSGVGRYEFRHELIRDVIYTGLTATRRAHLHRRVAEFLEDQRREDGDPPLRAIVEHLRQARDLVPAGELADRVVRAADAAAAERTHSDAAALYAEAVDLLADRPDDAERRCRVLIALGHARRRAAHGDGVETAFFEAAQAARDQRRPDLLISAALGLCAVPFSAGDRPVDLALVALLEEALEAAPDSDTAT